MTDQQHLSDLMTAVIAEIKSVGNISESAINLWFQDLTINLLADSHVVVSTRSLFKRDMINKNHLPLLQSAFSSVIGKPMTVEVRVTDGEVTRFEQEIRRLNDESSHPASNRFSTVAGSAVVNYATKPIADGYTFDNFLVGSSNKFAYAAAMAVSSSPSQDYNPLLFYSLPGLGKTHLLYAIVQRLRTNRPELNVIYVKGEEFTNQLIDAITRNATKAFHEHYRTADVLIIDDIQFIAGKEATQEEFFHTFNELFQAKKQIILSSDRPPRDIQTLEDRLKSRLEWGLLADINPPDFELRTAILKNKAKSVNLDMPDDVCIYIAENLKNNVRQLEGAVKKIAAQSFLTGMPVTVDMAIGCIADFITPSEPVNVTVDKILDFVSRHYDISVEDMKSKKRNASIARARHVSIYIIRKMTDMSLPAIGRLFSRDHTTVMASLEKIESEIKNSATMEIDIREIMKNIKG